MNAPAVGRASGKLILCGEHAVVYGFPALAFAVSQGTEVTLSEGDGLTVDAATDDARLRRALAAVLGDGADVTVHIHTTLPIGRGMGSSAALSVATARAVHAWRHPEAPAPSPEALFDAALPMERVFHANPSGLDVAVAVHGGVLRYVRAAPPVLQPLSCPTWQAVVIDTGTVGDTGALVQGVMSRRPGIDPQLERIGALVDEAAGLLDDPRALGALLDENHALLGQIGVSTPELDRICDLARAHGALGAKLSGAGGGGVVLALTPDPAPVLAAARAAGLTAWATRPLDAP